MFEKNKLIFFAATLFFALILSGAVAAEDNTALSSVSTDDNSMNGEIQSPLMNSYSEEDNPSVWATVDGNYYYEPLDIELIADESQLPSATIYYTTNEEDPTTSSTQYTEPIYLNNTGTTTLKFFAVDNMGNSSPIYSETYEIIDITPPSASADHDDGFFNTDPLSVEFSAKDDFDPEPEIYYWLNESEQTLYSGPILLSEGINYLVFYAVDNSGNLSDYYYKIYTVDTISPTAYAEPSGDTFNEPIMVFLFSNDNLSPETAIYYTMDGSDPTTSSTRYPETVDSSPIYFDSLGEHELKFIAVDAAGNLSEIYNETYTMIDTEGPYAYCTPNYTYYNHPITIELTAIDNFDSSPKIYYTLNGESPTTSSNLYTDPIDISDGQTTMKFFAVDNSGNVSPLYTKNYYIDSQPPTANATPIGGTYNNLHTIELFADDNMDIPQIYYSTNGEDPYYIWIWEEENVPILEITGNLYEGSINVESNSQIILKFFAIDNFENCSPIYTEIYNISDTISPTVTSTPTGGTYYNDPVSVNLQVHDNYPGSTIYYTLNGTEPNTSSTIYSGPIRLLEGNTTIKFFAADSSGNESPIYTEEYNLIDNAPPIVSADPTSCVFEWIDILPGFGYYNNYVQLFATDMDPNPLIYYTIDGTDPTTNGILYTGTITIPIESKTYLKFFGVDNKGNTSPIKTEIYYGLGYVDITPPTAYVTPQGNVYDKPIYLDIVATDPDDPITKIYYTTNGEDIYIKDDEGTIRLNNNAILYTAPFLIDKTTILKFQALNMPGTKSPLYYDIFIGGNGSVDRIPPTVTASESGGLYNAAQIISLNSSEPGHIYYTTNGDTPTTNSTEYTTPININTNTVLKYFAIDHGGNSSTIYTETYQIDTVKPEVEADLKTGSYNSVQYVNLSINEPGHIYYTTNGTTPTTSSKFYLAPLIITKTTTLKFIATDYAGNVSDMCTETYTIDTTPPNVQVNIPGGLYKTTQKVTLISSEPGHIYYTINGDTPTNNSTEYTTPITIDTNTTLKFIAVDYAGNSSQLQTETYTIDTEAPTVHTIDPVNGETEVTANKIITVTFSENIKEGNNWIELVNSNGTAIAFTSNINGNTLTITPNSDLAEDKYKLILHTGSLKDMAGNLVACKSIKFSVGTPPTIESTSPVDGATNVNVSKTLTLTFSESIRKSSNFWIELVDNTGTAINYTSYITNGNILVIKPVSNLAAKTTYKLKIHTGSVTDLAGNQVKGRSFSFTTRNT